MSKRLVIELDHDLLDVAVARECIAAGDLDVKVTDTGNRATILDTDGVTWVHFRPSVNWAHAGPIVERNLRLICPKLRQWLGNRWEESQYMEGDGRQLLCWLLRASVASRLGDEIDI